MAYKSNNSRGKGRSSSGRKSSGDDASKRTWNQRTSHDDYNAEEKPSRAPKDDSAPDRKPFKREERSSSFTGERKPFGDRAERKPYEKREPKADGETRERKPYTRRDDAGERKPFGDRSERKPYERREPRADGETRERKPYTRREDAGDSRERKPYGDRAERKPYERRESGGATRTRKTYGDRDDRKPFVRKDTRDEGESTERKPFERTERKPFDRKKYEGTPSQSGYRGRETGKRSFDKKSGNGYERKPLRKSSFDSRKSDLNPDTKPVTYPDGTVKEEKLTRLNKYLANSGICSRREADELIKAGLVSVNGVIVTEMGVKISRTDIVKYNNSAIRKEKKVYVLLNKPKDYITTTDDPGERKTVMSLVENAGRERIYPVGRLDRNTTGLLLITNDGELTKKLTHPSSNIKKIYHVELDKNLTSADLKKITAGIELEDGFIKVDEINYDGDGLDKKQVGIAIHSGKNRIVRRIFESLGYEVQKLDRVIFAGLTKKDLPRGKWRNLSEIEVNMLKMIAGTRS